MRRRNRSDAEAAGDGLTDRVVSSAAAVAVLGSTAQQTKHLMDSTDSLSPRCLLRQKPDSGGRRRLAGRGQKGGLARLACLAAAVWAFSPADGVSQDGVDADRASLEALYDATGGADWTDAANWKTDAPLGEWAGVTTGASGRVIGLNLTLNGLTGPVPDALGNLSDLEDLNLSYNALTGPIPDTLGKLSNLRFLNLDTTQLTGPISSALEKLSNLQFLDLRRNDLTGPVPAWLGGLSNLRALILGGNALTGPIPDALGNLSNLSVLGLGGNDLTGPVPARLGDLPRLSTLGLARNWGVSGRLPPSLRTAPLQRLDIWFTQACAPRDWRMWLAAIDFEGALCGGGVMLDIAVVYTPAARAAAGGTAAIEAAIDLMVAATNQAYEAGGVLHRLRLAGRSEAPYTETGDSREDLNRLIDPSDGYMDDVHDLRDRVGADLVHLIVDADKTDVGGRAWRGGPFALSHHRGDGGVFAHEVGHNMGLEHDRYRVHHHEGGTSGHPAYGYVNQRAFEAGADGWITIMAYHTQCFDSDIICRQLFRFSNPRQTWQGDPLGVAYGSSGSGVTGPADAVAVLNATGSAVALWRDRPPGANRPPSASEPLPDRRLELSGALTVNVSDAFVDPDGDPLTYAVSTSEPDVVTVLAAGARVTLTAAAVGRAVIVVTAIDPDGLSASQSFTVRVTASFNQDPLVPGVTPIRAIHFTELRARIDALRRAGALRPFAWTDPVLTAGVTPVRLVHLLELREAVGAAYAAAGRTAPWWTDAAPAVGATPIRAAHLMELRAAVAALE